MYGMQIHLPIHLKAWWVSTSSIIPPMMAILRSSCNNWKVSLSKMALTLAWKTQYS